MTELYNGAVNFNETSKIYTVSTSIATKDLNSLLNTAVDNATIQFEAGKYILTESLNVFRGNLTMKGAGEDLTVFETNFTKVLSTFYFSGTLGTATTALSDINVGTTSITVADAPKFYVGGEVRVYQSNDAAFINQPIPADLINDPYLVTSTKNAIINSGTLYGDVANDPFMAKNPLRESLSEIAKIEGNTIYLKDPVDFDLDAGVAMVQRVNALDGLKFSDFTIQTTLDVADPSSMTNAAPEWKGTNAIGLFNTRGTELSNISLLNSGANGLTLARGYEIKADHITIIGAVNKGDGANGYGLNIAGTQHSDFDNLVIFDTRHAVLFSSWGTETNNTVHILETNRDVNFHGSPDLKNVVTVDKSILDYVNSSGPGWGIVSTMASIHPYTDMKQNDVSFNFAIGSRGIDVIEGSDHGAYLRGGAGNDILIGGAGNDVLIGDTQADTLTGGKGADYFVMTNEMAGWGATDTITDFNSAEGDKIVFINVNKQLVESDVFLTALGNDVKIWTKSFDSYALVKNVTLADISMKDIILNVKPYSENPLDYEYHEVVLPPKDAAQVFTAHSAIENFTGGTGDDRIIGWGSIFKGDSYNMGAGDDTLVVRDTVAWVKPDTLPIMSGIDVIDISASSQVGKVAINNDMIRQSDNGVLVIRNDDTVIKELNAQITDKTLKLYVDSIGDIYLGDRLNNVVYAHDNNKGVFYGSTGKDTFFGGAGQDVFAGGAAKDTFVLIANKDGSADIIKDFNTSDHDVLDLSHMLFGYDPTQSLLDDFVRISSTGEGHTAVFVDRDGAGNEFAMEKAVVFETTVDMTAQDMLAHKYLVVS